MPDVSLLAAFLAGLVSFLSPCVLPLVPGYISMLSGIGMEQLRQGQPPRAGLFASSLAFVVGFSVVFISFGASASAVGTFLRQNRTLLAPIAGALILLFGLHLLGILIKLTVRTGLILGVLLAGLGAVALFRGGPLFAGFGAVHFFSLSLIGFFGPAMTRWLNRDVRLRTSSTGVLLLAVYSAGLAVPFLLTALGIGQFLRFYQRFRKHLHAVEVFSGALLLFVGGLVFVNRLTWMAGKFSFLNSIVLWLERSLTGAK